MVAEMKAAGFLLPPVCENLSLEKLVFRSLESSQETNTLTWEGLLLEL